MKTFFRILAKSIAVVFAALFVATALLSLLLVTLGARLFDPDLYKNALIKQQVYEQLPEIIADMLVTSSTYDPCVADPIRCEAMAPELATCYIEALGIERFVLLTKGEAQPSEAETAHIQSCFTRFSTGEDEPTSTGGMPIFFHQYTAGDWASLLRRVLPPGELQAMAEQVLDDTFSWLKGDTDRVTLSLLPFKARLAGATGDEMLLELITSQPDCADELMAIITGEQSVDELTLCNPPELFLPLALSTTRLLLDEAIGTIPDEVVILPAQETQNIDDPSGSDPVSQVRLVRLVMFLSPLLPLACLGLLTLFGVRSLTGWLRWWGIPLTLTGTLATGMSAAALLAWQPAWERWVLPRFPAYLGATFASLAHNLYGFLVRDLALWIGGIGLLLLLVGLVMWVTARFFKKKENPPPPPTPKSQILDKPQMDKP